MFVVDFEEKKYISLTDIYFCPCLSFLLFLSKVPFNLYLITQSYFATYHLFSNFLLRRLWRAVSSFPSFISYAIVFLFLCVFSYFVAFTETFTIQHVCLFISPITFLPFFLTFGFVLQLASTLITVSILRAC